MKVSRFGIAGEVEHAPRGEHVRALGVDVAGGHVLHDLRRAAALGMDHELGAGVLGAHGGDVGRADARVDVALAVPDCMRRPVRARRRRPATCRAEQDLHVVAVLGADVLDHLDGVRGRAAVVGLRLHLGRRVDVHDDDAPGCWAFQARS